MPYADEPFQMKFFLIKNIGIMTIFDVEKMIL